MRTQPIIIANIFKSVKGLSFFLKWMRGIVKTMKVGGVIVNSVSFRFSKNPILFWFISLPGFIWIVTNSECKRVYHTFSVPELFRTLFAPWKRDEVSTKNVSLDEKFRIMMGNAAGRFIAFFIRLFTIFTGFGAVLLIFLLGILLIFIDITFPFMVVILAILGVRL